MTGVELYSNYAKEDQLIRDMNESQRVVSEARDWIFELYEDESIALVQGENKYELGDILPTLKYPLNYQGLFSVKMGNYVLRYLDPEDMDAIYQFVKSSVLASPTTVGGTTVTLENSSSFPDNGTVDIGENIGVSYSANDKTTGILSGIPASGTGSVTDVEPAGRSVFQNIAQSYPQAYTVWNGTIILNCPVNEQMAGIDLKIRYLRRIPKLTSFQDVTLVPFYQALPYYLAYKIEQRKRNYDDAKGFLEQFTAHVSLNADIYKIPQQQNYLVYRLMNNSADPRNAGFQDGWNISS